MRTSADLLIVGDGPSGMFSALAARRRGLSCIVLGLETRSISKPLPELLAPPGLRELEQFGIENRDLESVGRDCRGVWSTWSHPQPGFFDYELLGTRNGVVIDRVSFDGLLTDLVGVSVHRLGKPAQPIFKGDRWGVVVNGDEFSSSWLIDARGRRAKSEASYEGSGKETAFYCRIPLQEESPPFLTIEPNKTGWFYSMSSSANEMVVVFMSDSDLLPPVAEDRRAELSRLLSTTTLVQKAGDITNVGPFRAKDARIRGLSTQLPTRYLSVGDAAFTHDPLAGQGLHFSMKSALRAVEVVASGGSEADYKQWVTDEFDRVIEAWVRTYADVDSQYHTHEYWQRRLDSTSSENPRLIIRATQ